MTQLPSPPDRLQPDRCALVVVDLQEKFAGLIHHQDEVTAQTARLIRFCGELEVPVLVTEHYPSGLGATIPEIAGLFPEFAPLEKIHFSCWGEEGFRDALAATGRDQIVLCGIEAHVCIYQTALDLLREGRQAVVAADAVGSCAKRNRKLGLKAMRAAGVQVLGTQMIMFEILHRAGDARFKAVAELLRGD